MRSDLFVTRPRAVAVPMDAFRDENRIVVQLDLPGVERDSIDVEVDRKVLTVRAKRPQPADERSRVLISERPYGEFTRRLVLGDHLDRESIQASYADGVLTLTLGVAEQAKPRKIEITPGTPAAASAGTVEDDAVAA